MIKIQEIKTKKGLKEFVKFPFELYKGNPYWVPPMINEELESFDKEKNPVFENASARFFIALKDNKIAGRVAAIINRTETEGQGIPKMRFGWMDFIDDHEVSKALFDTIEEIGRENGLEFMEGPVGFSNMDKVGVLTEGFDQIGTMVTWYNHPYYMEHYEGHGFRKEKKFLESFFYTKAANAERFARMAEIVKRRYQLRSLRFKSSKEIMPYATEMFRLFNTSYEKLSSFVPISDKQIEYFKEKYLGFINPDFIKMVEDKEGKIIAFGITMPSFAEALQKAKGKLFPTGFIHLLRAKKHSKASVFYLIGIEPSYQKKGVTAIIFDEFHKAFARHGVEKCIITPELEENLDIQLIWDDFDPVHNKRRTTYRRDFT